MTWNWQDPDWPHFVWQADLLAQAENLFLQQAGIVVGASSHLGDEENSLLFIELMSNEATDTSQIEGETLDRVLWADRRCISWPHHRQPLLMKWRVFYNGLPTHPLRVINRYLLSLAPASLICGSKRCILLRTVMVVLDGQLSRKRLLSAPAAP
jgi:hypothetical protein